MFAKRQQKTLFPRKAPLATHNTKLKAIGKKVYILMRLQLFFVLVERHI